MDHSPGAVMFEGLAVEVNRFYAVHVEPLLFSLRRHRLFAKYGMQEEARAAVARLDLGDPECHGDPLCGSLVRRYQQYFRRFRCRQAGDPGLVSGAGTLAILDLRRYRDSEDFSRELRKKSGNFHRDSNKARRKGYRFRPFHHSNHKPDICAIRKSLKIRSFGPVLDAFLLTLDAMGGAPTTWHPLVDPPCHIHWEKFFGVFVEQPSHLQGTLKVNERLVAYARLHRVGNVVRYAELIGHGSDLREGIMMLLHGELVAWLLDPDNALATGVHFVTYGAMEQGGEGLLFWKRKALFAPHVLLADP